MTDKPLTSDSGLYVNLKKAERLVDRPPSGVGATLLFMPTHVVQVNQDQEVLQVMQEEVDRLGVVNAAITLIGAVSEATVSVMDKDDESVDHLRRYSQPFELSGTGEVVEGRVHLHVTLAGEDVVAAGHLHRAVVGGFFVRAYLSVSS